MKNDKQNITHFVHNVGGDHGRQALFNDGILGGSHLGRLVDQAGQPGAGHHCQFGQFVSYLFFLKEQYIKISLLTMAVLGGLFSKKSLSTNLNFRFQ